MRGGLHRLQAPAQFVYLAGTLPRRFPIPTPFAEIFTDIEYSFKHVITQEVAYSRYIARASPQASRPYCRSNRNASSQSPRASSPELSKQKRGALPKTLLPMRSPHVLTLISSKLTKRRTMQRTNGQSPKVRRRSELILTVNWHSGRRILRQVRNASSQSPRRAGRLLAHHALRGELREGGVIYSGPGYQAAEHFSALQRPKLL